MTSNPGFLDVDPTIVERNLQFTENAAEEELKKIFQPNVEYPCKVVKPTPGFCVKTKELGTGMKIFVNVCQTDLIPEPNDVTEEELQEMCLSEDDAKASQFRIPISIGEVRREVDKQNNEVKAVDVAINPKFLSKVQTGHFYRSFLLAVIFEALAEKHGLFATDERSILQHRKAYGTLQAHRIQQREIKEQMDAIQKGPLIEEVRSENPQPKIQLVQDRSGTKVPVYKLFKKLEKPSVLYGEFNLPEVINTKDITLDIGEDRIVLEAQKQGYFLDVHVPATISQDDVSSTFNIASKILTVTMPITVA